MKWHSDPGHGWLEVPTALIGELGIGGEITAFSYMSRDGRTAYLEEDQDAATFAKAWVAAGRGTKEEILKLEDAYHEDDRIRGLPCFEWEAAHDFREQVHHSEEEKALAEGPHGSIQWKGTSVCMDMRCSCGGRAHMDAEFLYFYKCLHCGAKYALSTTVRLIPLNEEQAAYVEGTAVGFLVDEDLETQQFIDGLKEKK